MSRHYHLPSEWEPGAGDCSCGNEWPCPDALLDEECTRCGVRQDWLGPCDDCAIKDSRGLRSNVDTNAIADAVRDAKVKIVPPNRLYTTAELSPGVVWCSHKCGWSNPYGPDVAKTLVAHLRSAHPEPPAEVTFHPKQVILSPGSFHCYGCGVSIGGGTDADRMDWFTNHPCPGRTTSKKETGVLATVRRWIRRGWRSLGF